MIMRLYENGNELPGEWHLNEVPQIGCFLTFKAGNHEENWRVLAVQWLFIAPYNKCGRINVTVGRIE